MKQLAIARCAKAVSLFRGLYARVARDLGVDVSYVSRIARGQRRSKVAEKAITKELHKVMSHIGSGLALSSEKRYVVAALQCPRCKTSQKVRIAVRPRFGATGRRRV
jgi:hypothetical protein